jgi:hypothetical protein
MAVDEAQKQVDALRRVESGARDPRYKHTQPEVTLNVSMGSSTATMSLSAEETDKVLETLRIMRGQTLAQAVAKFETIDLSIIDDYDTENL